MSQSALLSLLRRAPDARLVILHADDVGMCEASVSAFRELTEIGTISSASVMAPCPWFPAVAEYCARHPHVDIGAHLTLTSEWSSYRWGPVSRPDPSSGLTDAAGYFHRDRDQLGRRAQVNAVRMELQAQVERTLAAGIDVSHVDAHMFSCLLPQYFESYVDVASEFRIPALIWPSAWEDLMFLHEAPESALAIFNRMQSSGLVPLDHVIILGSSQAAERPKQIRETISGLQPGVTHILIHPSKDTSELREICPAGWFNRVADYEAFRDRSLLDFIRAAGVELIGYREVRKALRGRTASNAN